MIRIRMPASRETIGWRWLMVIMKVLRQFAWVRTQANRAAATKFQTPHQGKAAIRARSGRPDLLMETVYRSILEKSATASVAARISLSSLSRFARTDRKSVVEGQRV